MTGFADVVTAIAYLSYRLGLVPIVGFLVAGVLLGPHGFSLVQDRELVDAATCSQEIFVLTVVALCLGTAWVTSLAGISLSLGAFLAGLLVSKSKWSGHALGEILPLRVLFSATFFLSVGMLLDLGFLWSHWDLVLAVVSAVLVIKLLTTAGSVLALGYGLPTAAASGLILAQVGEFSFVLKRAGQDVGLHPAGSAELGPQTLIATTVLLMAATPLLAGAGVRVGGWLERRRQQKGADRMAAATPETVPEALGDLSDHVIVAGYGRAARRLVRALVEAGVPYVITTLSPEGADEAESMGRPVLRGDAGRGGTLRMAGVERARVLVVADDEPATAHHIVSVARMLNTEMRIVVRTRFPADAEELRRAGADRVVAEELEAVVGLFADVLRDYGVSPEQIEGHEESLRRGDYAALQGIGEVSEESAPDSHAGTEGSERRIDTERSVTLEPSVSAEACSHLDGIRTVVPSAPGCEECLREGGRWVHLRICMTCGHVGCCDESPGRHATAHVHGTGHPVVRSLEPGEEWGWCYVDEVML